MHISVLTLFPGQFSGPFDTSIIRRALDRNIISISYIDIRDFADDAYKSVDDHPYGGGRGMILRVDVVDRAISAARASRPEHHSYTVLLDPAGKQYTQHTTQELSRKEHIILVCGHYEGVDDRVRSLADLELSIGDYILTGGEIPAMVIIDSVTRLLSGTLPHQESFELESFGREELLEYPQYTRPREYNGMPVPEILLSGNHADIKKWRNDMSRKRTADRRPDLLTGQTDSPLKNR